MSVLLYTDQHVRVEIINGIRARGVDVLTARQDRHDAAPDDILLERATRLNRVLFSQDRDLLVLASERQRTGVHFPGLIYAHQLGITIGQCVEDLVLLCLASDAAEWQNRVVFLPL